MSISFHWPSTRYPPVVSRMRTRCPQVVHRISTRCPQDVHKISTMCTRYAQVLELLLQVVPAYQEWYPQVFTTLVMTFLNFLCVWKNELPEFVECGSFIDSRVNGAVFLLTVLLTAVSMAQCSCWQFYWQPCQWRSVLAGSGAFVHHETASQLSWHVTPAAGALCERGALFGDTIKSTPHFKAPVGVKFKDSSHIARSVPVPDTCSRPHLHPTSSTNENHWTAVRNARYVVAVCTVVARHFIKSFGFFQHRTYFTGFVSVDDHKQFMSRQLLSSWTVTSLSNRQNI